MTKPLWAMAHAVGNTGDAAADARLKVLLGGFRETSRSSTYGPYGNVGLSRMNARTHDGIIIAHHLAGASCTFTQGGLNNGAVAASAKVHDGLDVADTRTRGMSIATVRSIVSYGMDCGAIGFIRGRPEDNISDGMVEHIHWVILNAQYAHPTARAQIFDSRYGYASGGAGLAGMPWARWWGPARKPLIEWARSKYNPGNGWRP